MDSNAQNSRNEYRLKMENITVKYGDFTANDSVDLAVSIRSRGVDHGRTVSVWKNE